MSTIPKYWHSGKGRILKAIAIDGARTWSEIQQKTGFQSKTLNEILSELFSKDILSKNGQSYWIEEYDLYKEYVAYSEKTTKQQPAQPKPQTTQLIQLLKQLTDYITRHNLKETVVGSFINWTYRNGIKLNLVSEHIFLQDDMLDRASKDLISMGQKQVVVINPFVDACSLSDKLHEMTSSCSVSLITRDPNSERDKWGRDSKKKYHKALREGGVDLKYNDRVHAKVILVDQRIGVVSSMNLYSGSTGGRSKEAGIISWNKDTIKSLNEYVYSIWNDPQTSSC